MVKHFGFLPIYPEMRDLTKLSLEPRKAIMAVAEVVWEDQSGDLRRAFAKIEDTSRSGACIRVSSAINVGAKLNIKWRQEQFSGAVKYCRQEGEDYVLGIQRETSENQARTMVLLNDATSGLPAPSSAKAQKAPPRPAKKVQKLPNSGTMPGPKAVSTVDSGLLAVTVSKMTEASKVTPENQAKANSRALGPPSSQGKLLSLQEIYLAVGIMSLRPGYSSNTVAEMLDSDHMRGMTNDVKRASVLMALETAGISPDEVLHDGAKRLDAIDAYEAGQRKCLEEFEAWKSQENAQIQLEIERMTAHCLERMKHNLGEVTLAKDAFLSWQATKQKESQRISEALAVFTKPPDIKHANDSKPVLQTVSADWKQ
jgi:hypothetical protein